MRTDFELAIVGGGPAGVASGIYARRAGIEAVLFERQAVGGQVSISPLIENYPGTKSITGLELSQRLREHVAEYVPLKEYEDVQKIQPKDGSFLLTSSKSGYEVAAIILATGAHHRLLGVPGEEEFTGKGVSYCATCDGFFFKGKEVAVIGGGNTATVEAIYLHNLGVKTTLVHRRHLLRAEKAYQEEIKRLGIGLMLNTVVEEIKGKNVVQSIVLRDVITDEKREIALDGVFVSVGLVPNNELAKQLGAKLTDAGYILVDSFQRTTIKGVYAAGDVTGGARQIVVSCAQGAQAALASTEVLGKQYPF